MQNLPGNMPRLTKIQEETGHGLPAAEPQTKETICIPFENSHRFCP